MGRIFEFIANTTDGVFAVFYVDMAAAPAHDVILFVVKIETAPRKGIVNDKIVADYFDRLSCRYSQQAGVIRDICKYSVFTRGKLRDADLKFIWILFI